MALTESISHLNLGLELAASLPASDERDATELALRTLLGTAWMALKGWAAPEVWESFRPALALAKSIGRNDALLPILWGLYVFVLCEGRVAETMRWAEEMLDTATATGDDDLLVVGHMAVCDSYYWLGKLNKTLEHYDQLTAVYDAEKHRHLADILFHDPKTVAGIFASVATWMLGYPDRAVRLRDENESHARRRGHPFDLGFLLAVGADVSDYRSEPDQVRKRTEECERLGRENSLPILGACLAPVRAGFALIHEGNAAEGIALLRAALTIWDASGGKLWTHAKAILAEGMAMTGDIDGALQLVDGQIAQIERSGWEERIHYAEILRLKGWMLSLKGDGEGAEKNYLASLEWAREQQAKSWELRTATSLARLWRSQGKRNEAHGLLEPVYNWFTEGFDTKDLKEAKLLLDQSRT
jgi:predicted ATPase